MIHLLACLIHSCELLQAGSMFYSSAIFRSSIILYTAKAQQMCVYKPADSTWFLLGFVILCPKEIFHTPKFSCSWLGLTLSQLCQAFRKYSFTWGHPGLRDGDGVPPKYHEGFKRLPFCVFWLLLSSCVQIKMREDTSLKSCIQAPKLSEEIVLLQCMIYPWVENIKALSSHWSSPPHRHNLTHQSALGSPVVT